MQHRQNQQHKFLVKSELALWHAIGDTGPIQAIGRSVRSARARFLGLAVVIGALLIGITSVGVYLNSGADNGVPQGTTVSTPAHVAKHRALPHSEHLTKTKPVTAPGSHLGKHVRNWVTVRHGDSLWVIAQRYLVPANATPAQIVQAVQRLELRNHLSNASLLFAGQRVYL
jgi:LysM repeat protein